MLGFVLYFTSQQIALLKAASKIVNKYGENIHGKEQEPAC